METLGEAKDAGVQIELRCHRPSRIGTAKVGRCGYGGYLDLQTLLATRGHAFPLALLQSRLKCPRCGDRRVMVLFYGGRSAPAAAVRK